MKSCHGCVLPLLIASLLWACWPAQGAPLQYHHNTGSGAGEPSNAPLYLSLAVLVALVVLLVNCVTCCKERHINFKEFEDHFDDEIDFTPPAEDTPSMQSPAEVYTLAVSPVALPGPLHLQPPAPIAEGSTGVQVARHSLSYIQEIGNGWFGQVILSEIYTDGTRVIVKELKANANGKEQNDFLQQGDPFRVLQHPHILQCLGQCVEAIPFLLVFEYCEMGDLRGYLSQQDWTFRSAELLQLQRMACEIAAGLTHLHKYNFLHSDLALRNCYLTADLTVKVGDYGIGPYAYKEDYIITEDDAFAPLRWLAPELVAERHGGVIALQHSKSSNVWSLGVTLWELFENAGQPYPHLSDREVLNHVIKEQQVKLFKPQLELPYSDRWYEVLQFCWLSPDKRATAEEVHRLLIYLRMQGQRDIEEDFEQRWDALKPSVSTRQTTVSHSPFPILKQFADDALEQDVDEVLTVTETSKGLSFEYIWEAAKHDHYDGSHLHPGMDTTVNYHSMFFPVSTEDIQAHFPDPVARSAAAGGGNTPSGIPVPVFDAQKPANGDGYYIQLEDQAGESAIGQDGARRTGFNSSQQDFVVLQDVRLDESSTDADFFHHSIDSRDSYLPDSHIWSSLENDSPYQTNIFTEGESKQEEDSVSWRHDFVERPDRNRNPFCANTPLDVRDVNARDSFLGSCLEATRQTLEEASAETKGHLNTEKLAENFIFLKEQDLMKEDTRFLNSQQNFLSPGVVHEPEANFKMASWDNLDTYGSLNTADSYLKPAWSSASPRQGILDSSNTNFGEHNPFRVQNETLVPSIAVFSEGDISNQLPASNRSSTEDLTLLQLSDGGVDSDFHSTSEKLDILVSQTDDLIPAFSESATTEVTCTDANLSSLDLDIENSNSSAQQLIVSPIPEKRHIQASVSGSGHIDDLTSAELLSEVNEDAGLEMESNLSDHEELFTDTSGQPLGRSSLLVSGPSLDQISQDSLLEDSMSTTLPTVDHSAETPDSLDSLDIHRLGDQHKLHPPYKIADSGYETENLESPEWNSLPNDKDLSPVKNDGSVAQQENDTEETTAPIILVPPEIVISEPEGSSDAPAEDCDDINPVEEPLMSGNYRDSAYFSDNESEPEKKSEETKTEGSVEVTLLRNPTEVPVPVWESLPKSLVESLIPQEEASAPIKAQGDVRVEPVSSPDMHLDVNEKVIEPRSWPNHDGDGSDFFNDLPESPEPDQPSPTSPLPSAEDAVHAKLTRTYTGEAHKIKEPDMEGRYLGRRDAPEDGMDADEENENSDDSDEDVHAYQLHSSSSDSEDEGTHAVPLIISDDSDAKNLRSLLKPATLNSDASSPSATTTRRAVSFFDDVTVYLFDQDTPTKELGDHLSGSNLHTPQFSSPVPSSSYLNRFTNSESSTDEEGGGFEWDDDFPSAPAFPSKTHEDVAASKSSAASRISSAAVAAASSWGSSNYSRFSISPASIASFSLTHLTDSDIEQGGSSEDGEKD